MGSRHVYRRREGCEPDNPLLKQLLTTWRSKKGTRPFPSRQDLSPRDFTSLLPYTVLARVEGNDFEFRVIGEAVVEAYGKNYTGRRLSALDNTVSDSMQEAYHTVARTAEPVLLAGWFERSDQDAFRREVLLVPLGSGDVADYVLSAGVYEPHSPIAVQYIAHPERALAVSL